MKSIAPPLLTAICLTAFAPFATTQDADPVNQQIAGIRSQLQQSEAARIDAETRVQHLNAAFSRSEHQLAEVSAQLMQTKAQLNKVYSENAALQDGLNERQMLLDAKQRQLDEFGHASSRMEDKLTTAIYSPQIGTSQELSFVAGQVLGDEVWYFTQSVPPLSPDRESRARFTSMPNSNTLIITGFPEDVDRAKKFLAEVEAQYPPEPPVIDPVESSYESRLFEPLSLTFSQIETILGIFEVSADPLEGASAIILQGDAAELDLAQAMLKTADKPIAQIQLRAWLVAPVPQTDRTPDHSKYPRLGALPEELSKGLTKLVPNQSFGSLTTMLTRTSTRTTDKIIMNVMTSSEDPNIEQISSWELEGYLGGYHDQSKTLNFDQLTMRVNYTSGHTDHITLGLSIIAGEYAVIGSIQGGQMYVVLAFDQL